MPFLNQKGRLPLAEGRRRKPGVEDVNAVRREGDCIGKHAADESGASGAKERLSQTLAPTKLQWNGSRRKYERHAFPEPQMNFYPHYNREKVKRA